MLQPPRELFKGLFMSCNCKKKKRNIAIEFILAMLKWALSGFTVVSKEELKKRRERCLRCWFSYINARGKDTDALAEARCPKCRCFLRFKTLLKTESCPIAKW